MAWWESFFDEAYVDAWAADGAFDASEQQALDLVRFLGLPPGARILDAPCGFGRFAGPLHIAGYEVTGIDASEDQIRLARERHPGPAYELADMRRPPEGPYDAVLNLYSSFGYFADPDHDRTALEAWFAVLRPGGLLVVETMHRDRLAHLWGRPMPPSDLQEEGETDWVTGVRTARVRVDGEVREFQVRLYTVTALVAMLHGTGFTDVEVFGGLSGEPFDPSTRLALRARRPEAA